MNKQYFVIYTIKEIGYYQEEIIPVAIVDDEDVAKDFCTKYSVRYGVKYKYEKEEVR